MNVTDISANITADACLPTEFGLSVEKASRFFIPLIYGSICIIGVIGNSLVLVVVWKGTSNAPLIASPSIGGGGATGGNDPNSRHGARVIPARTRQFGRTKRNTTDVFMGNLAIADCMVCALVIPPTIIDQAFKTSWLFGLYYCKLQKYMAQLSVYISIYTLVFMSLDRYLAVVHPFTSRGIRTAKNAALLIGALWVFVCLAASPILHISKLTPIPSHGEDFTPMACGMDFFMYSNSGYTIYKNVFLFCGYLIPLAAISILYWRLISTLWAKRPPGCTVVTTQNTPSSTSHQSEESLRGKKRVAKMVLVVVSLFALCLMPTAISFYLQDTKLWKLCNAGVFIFASSAHVMLYANSCCNPFVYCFSSDRFRLSLLQTLPFKIVTMQPQGHSSHNNNQPPEDPTTQATAGAVQMTSASGGVSKQSMKTDKRKMNNSSPIREEPSVEDLKPRFEAKIGKIAEGHEGSNGYKPDVVKLEINPENEKNLEKDTEDAENVSAV
ncbi:allatostatin-A receptor-like [Convolutriloba macropyga]|uniref:allatostatin-A receptor-like n=1 Tax=Convolutriloba macropyga TaxID=536237 RepID=UPI003F523D76